MEYAESDEQKLRVVVKKKPYSHPRPVYQPRERKVVEVVLAPRASENLLRRCFGKPDGMRDIVTREKLIIEFSDRYRLNIAKWWLKNMELEHDVKALEADAARGRRFADFFQELFEPKAVGYPPKELFVSCGVAPDLLHKVLHTGFVPPFDFGAQGDLMSALVKETNKENRAIAVPCTWMRLEFEELCMYKRVREDIYAAFYDQVTANKLSENEVWHCAVEQVNAARQFVADFAAYRTTQESSAGV